MELLLENTQGSKEHTVSAEKWGHRASFASRDQGERTWGACRPVDVRIDRAVPG